MFVVTGASGQTGRATALALLEQNQPVTAVVRSKDKEAEWKARGAEVAVLDLADSAALIDLLRGKAGAFLMIPPSAGEADYIAERQKIIDAFARAVRDSQIPHIVLLSSMGAQHAAGTGLILVNHNGEEALRPVAQHLTLLRAAYFLENWGSVLHVARENGILPSFLTPSRKIESIATKDIGRFAAHSLVNPAVGLRIVEIAGPEDYTPEDIAKALSQVLNKEVTLHALPLEAVVPTLTGLGMPEGPAKLVAQMYEAINSGYVSFEHKGDVQLGSVTPVEVFQQLTQ